MELEAPTTIHDFERMILQTPNSSLVWVQFMAFWVGSMQIEKAREVATKALKVRSPIPLSPIVLTTDHGIPSTISRGFQFTTFASVY